MGVPLIVPVLGSSASPVGRAGVTVNVSGAPPAVVATLGTIGTSDS